MFHPSRLAALTLTFLLAACGGGGGGSSSASDNALRIGALSPTELSLKWADARHSTRPLVILSAGYTGVPAGNVYVVVEDPDKLFTSAVPTVGSSQATLELHPVSDELAPGRYTKPLVVHVCKDAACASEYAGSPQTVRKDILVEGLVVTPAKLNFTAPLALGAAAQTVTVTPPAGKAYNHGSDYVFHRSPDGVRSSTAFRPEEVFDITQTAAGLQIKPKGAWAGQYTWDTWLEAPGYARKSLQVVYDVAGRSGEAFAVLTPQLTATATGDEVVYADVDVKVNIPPSMTGIRVAGTPDPVDHGWLLSYDTLALEGGRRFRFRLTRCGYGVRTCLAAGTHTGSVELTASAFGANWTYTVPVSFTVR